MRLSGFREAYYTQSGKASDVARSLAFAGIAIVWLFKVGEAAGARVDRPFVLPLLLLVGALAADLLQYSVAALLWGGFHRHEESELEDLSEDPDVAAPIWLNWPALALFWGKLVLVAAAYVVLWITIWKRWF